MSAARRSQRAVILLAEDDPGDQELTRRSLQGDLLRTDLRIVNDGEEALDYLFRRGRYSDAEISPVPDLVMLDLNMPRVDGKQVLETIRGCPTLYRIPVIILTTSSEERDIVRSYDLGCSSFLEKPVEVEAFMAAIRALRRYWFELVTLPPVEVEGR